MNYIFGSFLLMLCSKLKCLKLLPRHTLTCSSQAESYHEIVNNFMERVIIQMVFLRIIAKYKRRKKGKEK